jgi:hypothetical protein
MDTKTPIKPAQPVATPTRPAVASRPVATPQNRFPFKTTPQGAKTTRFTAFIYGFSGTGKTYIARTVLDDPALYPALVCICDRGGLSLQDVVDDERLVVTDTRTVKDFNAIFDYLKNKPHNFKTVIIDNLSELQRSGLIEQAKRASENKDTRTGHEFTQQDYGIVRNQILSLVSNFTLELSLNVILTALASKSTDQITGIESIEPNLAGKLAAEVPGYCDVVGYLSIKPPTMIERKAGQTEPTRNLQVVQSTQVATARNRGGRIGTDMVNPTLPKLFHAMTADL